MALDLACRETGDGPPLVILHGLFGNARNWDAIAGRLARDWRVLAFDLRNHGDSPWDDDCRYTAMAADVIAGLEARAIERAAVVGHSMGGKVAMALALDAPDRVAGLVVVDIAPADYPRTFLPHVRAMRPIDLARLTRRSLADRALAEAVPEAGVRGFLLQNLVRRGDTFLWRVNLAGLETGMAEIAGFPADLLERAYKGPTLFLAGGASDYIRPEHGDRIRALFPAARHRTLAGAGHWVHAEKPDAFTERLSDFLAVSG